MFAKGCNELKHGPSCHALAALYRKGHGNPDPKSEEPTREGIPKNGPRAAIAYALGCEMGYSPSCTALGLMKVNADGVEQQATEARTLFKRACDAGDATGCTCLGGAQQHAPRDRLLCGSRSVPAPRAVCHATGLGGEPDMSAATALFKQACDSGNDEACAFLRQAGAAADKGEDYIAADPVDGGQQ